MSYIFVYNVCVSSDHECKLAVIGQVKLNTAEKCCFNKYPFY